MISVSAPPNPLIESRRKFNIELALFDRGKGKI